MGNVIQFPYRPVALSLQAPRSFLVSVLSHDRGWLVVCRNHSWFHVTRAAAFTEARSVADGFGVGLLIDMRGAA